MASTPPRAATFPGATITGPTPLDGDCDGDPDDENDPTPVTIPLVEKAILGDKVFLNASGGGIHDAG